jgi:dTDP-4-amino-4,6-dideoxygalactose transaminase
LDPSLSFNGNKIITTSCGGAIVTKTKELKDRAIFLPHNPEMMHPIINTVK